MAILSRMKPDETIRGLARRRDGRAVAVHRGGLFAPRRRRAAGRLDLSAERQSGRHRKNTPTSSPGWSACASMRADRMALEEPLVLAGDYNVIPEPFDCHDPKVWEGDALFLPETRGAFRRLENLGLTDALRGDHRRGRPLHVLGLPGRRLAEEQRHPHRPSAALAGSGRPAGRMRHRKACPGMGEAVRPCPGIRPARPLTPAGRHHRLWTASMIGYNSGFSGDRP